jgi:phosphoribosylformylglycinamidine cyclo-ligase
VIGGFAKACKENRCSIIGGETAEMPGLYAKGEFDLAGTIVGVVEKKKIVDGKRIVSGDVLIGLPSTGLHTNGYSLARHVLLKKFPLKKRIPVLQSSLGDALLAVHRSYLKPITRLTSMAIVKGMSHITGGGIVGNTMRVLPKGLRVDIAWDMWDRPPLFTLIQQTGKVPEADMRRTFNLGIGLIMIVAPESCSAACRALRATGEEPMIIGEVI